LRIEFGPSLFVVVVLSKSASEHTGISVQFSLVLKEMGAYWFIGENKKLLFSCLCAVSILLVMTLILDLDL